MTSTKVRRGTFSRRCARCGWEGTYDTAGRANYAKRRHSCTKREDAMVRRAQKEARSSLVDRTPKPCLHKIADHQCGTRAKYILDRCRCEACTEANRVAENERSRQKAYGRYNKYVPAEFVRDHLRELAEYGIGLKTVAKLAGVSNATLTKIVYGLYASVEGPQQGCKGAGNLVRPPSRRVLRSTAEKIYAIEPVPANLPVGQPDHQRSAMARLHLQALVALGWSQSKLGDRLGIQRSNMTPVVCGTRVLTRGTVDKVEALYAELSMQLPPERNQRDRIAASRARNYAKARRWLPPLALEDVEDVDLVDEQPFDEIAIQRRMNGDKSVRLSKAEKEELRRRWIESGRALAELERVTGINSKRKYVDTEESRAS